MKKIEKMVFASLQDVKEKDYWLRKLSGNPVKSVFPYDYQITDQNLSPHKLSVFKYTITGELFSKLIKICTGSDAKLHVILVAGLTILLGKYSGSQDIIVGIPIYKQDSGEEFINTAVAIRNPVRDNMTLREVILQVHESIVEAIDNQNYPLESLLQLLDIPGSESNFPLFDTAILLKNIHDERHIEHIKLNLISGFFRTGESLEGVVGFNRLLYKESTIKRITRHFQQMMQQLLVKSGTPLRDVDWLDDQEKKQLLFSFNDTARDYPVDKVLHELFRQQVQQNPDRAAVSGEISSCPFSSILTYRELNRKSHQLAHVLKEKGVKSGNIVGLMVERSIEMIISILGILKAGGAYLPIDPGYPAERRQYMLADSGARMLVATGSLAAVKEADSKGNSEHIFLDSLEHLNFSTSHLLNFSSSPPSSLAYVIYTSGTTGRPKGVMVTHANVVNLVWGLKEKIYFNYNRDLRIGLIAPYVFDASVQQIFPALLLGHRLYIIPEEARIDAGLLLQFYGKQDIDISDGTPVHLDLIMERLLARPVMIPVKHFIIGGEALPRETAARFFGYFERMGGGIPRMTNVYGPTECCVDSTFYEVTGNCLEKYEHIPIGKPMPNYQVVIVDRRDQLQPLGVMGELCIMGKGVARGYLNNPELTAEKFYFNFKFKGTGKITGERGAGIHQSNMSSIYHTGDLARWQSDGNIEFLGRIDNQVKIRGFRIEPGEIENRLRDIDGIKKSVVIERTSGNGEKFLCAYVLSDLEVDSSILRRILSDQLPAYMVPAYFVRIDEIPLTASGKIDRKALPGPELVISREYVAPRDPAEMIMAGLWAEVLGIKREIISIDSNFFELGGYSLKAIILIGKIHREFNVKLTLAEVFNNPTIRGLARYSSGTSRDKYARIQPLEKKDYYSLSSAQRRLYILHRMNPTGTSYNMPEMNPLAGESVDAAKLEETFKRLINRHASLRTCFGMVANEPVQRVRDKVEFEIEYYDLSTGQYTIGEDKIPISGSIIKDFLRPFDLSRAPLLRIGLIKKSAGDVNYLLLVDMHHIISDGISHQVLKEDFIGLYEDNVLPPLRIQYTDFSKWQNQQKQQEELKQQGIYWLKEFPGEIPVLSLPADYPRPAVQGFTGRLLTFEPEPGKVEKLRELAIREGATLYMVLLALFNVLLSKLGSQEDIVVGTPIAGRSHPDLEQVIGMFVNTLALRNYPCGEKAFSGFLEEVKQKTLAAFDNQSYQFEDLVDQVTVNRDISRNPLFDVMLSFQSVERLAAGSTSGYPGSPGAVASGMATAVVHPDAKNDYVSSKFDMTLTGVESKQSLSLGFVYNTSLFKQNTVQRFAGYFNRIIATVINLPDTPLSQIEVMSAKEKDQVMYDFNRTETAYPADKHIHKLFAEQAGKTPDNIALSGPIPGHGPEPEPQRLTYGKLNETCRKLAVLLRAKGIGPGSTAAIMSEPAIEMIVAIIGVLQTGAFYVPIDPGNPGARTTYILNDSQARLLLTQGHLAREVSFAEETLALDSFFNSPDEMPDNKKNKYPDRNKQADKINNTAYMIYTSGTTGKPKGVLVKHKGLVNYVTWFSGKTQLTGEDKTVLTSSFSFDLGYTSLYPSLLTGGQLHLLPGSIYMFPRVLWDYIYLHRVTYLKLTPSLFAPLVDDPSFTEVKCRSLRLVVLGGEAIRVQDVGKAFAICRNLRVMNHYGPTEVTIGSIARFIEPDQLAEYKLKPTIGKPIFNTKVFILDKYLNLLPVGIAGELCLSGAGVAGGYFKQTDLTAQKFINNLFKQGNRAGDIYDRIYKTGDLARWLGDGNIEFLGRVDHQVKIRGYRIELGEIENQLLGHPEIKEAAVLDRLDKSGHKYLCAYIVPGVIPPRYSLGSQELTEYLSQVLPNYMIPSYFVQIEFIPLTANGKVDRQALPEPGIIAPASYVQPANETEKKLVEIWWEVLGIKKDLISIEASFFQLGGHSLKATILVSKISKEFNLLVPLIELFKTPTIKDMAKLIKRIKRENLETPGINGRIAGHFNYLVLLKSGHENSNHLFFIHDVTGEVDGYVLFCQYLETDFNCWGLRADRLKNYTPRDISIEVMARDYIEKIKKVQSRGPYYFAGWSLGGTVAFEVVRQLEQRGEEIAFLALIDSPVPQQEKGQQVSQFSLQSELDFIQPYLQEEEIKEKLRLLSFHQVWPFMVDYLHEINFDVERLKNLIPGNWIQAIPNRQQLGIKELVYYSNMMRSLVKARIGYRPGGKIKTVLHYFKATESKGILNQQWDNYCEMPVRVYEINGNHFSILKVPEVERFAGVFKNKLDKSIDTLKESAENKNEQK